MAKIKSSLTNIVCVLVCISLVIAALLAWVNNATTGPIAEKAKQTLANGIMAVMGTNELNVASDVTVTMNVDGKEQTFIIHPVADKANQPLGAAVESTTLGFSGDLKVLVGFAPDGTILGYTVLLSSETPGLGAKADQWFQKGSKGDIIGQNPAQEELSVTKDGGKVDAITASTITSRAFLKAVNQAYAAYAQQNKGNVAQNN